jgi:hypothetical protein
MSKNNPEKMSKRELAKQLRAGANLLEQSNWKKRALANKKETSFCMLGAIAAANSYRQKSGYLKYPPHQFSDAVFAATGHTPVFINDVSADTKDQVVSAMRSTARALEHGLSF